MRWWVLVAVTGCGRIAFDPIAGDARIGETADGRSMTTGDAAVDDIPNLVLWYTFDESSFAGFVLDHAGNHDADCTACPTAIAGRAGGAGAFDGSAQVLTTSDAPGLSTQSSLTIAAFAWPASVGANISIAAKAHDASATANSWQLEILDTGELRFKMRGTALGDEFVIGPAATAGAWQHVAGTWDGATMRFYVNGAVVGSTQMPDVVFDGNPILVGGDENGGGATSYFPGGIDDVRLYDRALTPAEILLLASQ